MNNIMYDNLMRQVSVLYVIIYARLSKEEEGKSKEEQNQIDRMMEMTKNIFRKHFK